LRADGGRRARGRVGVVALGGGCFQNALLLELATAELEEAGFEVWLPGAAPNDGAIAAGQALGALWNLTTVGCLDLQCASQFQEDSSTSR